MLYSSNWVGGGDETDESSSLIILISPPVMWILISSNEAINKIYQFKKACFLLFILFLELG